MQFCVENKEEAEIDTPPPHPPLWGYTINRFSSVCVRVRVSYDALAFDHFCQEVALHFAERWCVCDLGGSGLL